MNRPLVEVQLANVATAAVIGYVGWGEHVVALGLAPVIAYVWAQSPNRLGAGLALFAYYAAISRGLPHGTAVFFGPEASPAWGWVFWLASSLFLALPWLILWPAQRRGYWWRVPLALLLVTLPPIGVFGWGNPLTAAGALYPAMGWFGLLAVLAIMLAYCYATTSARPARYALMVHAALAFALVNGAMHTPPAATVKAMDTKLPGVGIGQYDFARTYANNQQLIEEARREAAPGKTLLFPETVAGLWLGGTVKLWQREALPGTIVLGAALQHPGGDYTNALVALTGESEQIIYRQRVPVPVGMWHPWAADSAIAHWRDPGVTTLQGTRYGALICYEQLLAWPALQTLWHRPQALIGASNDWWSADTSIPAIQRSVMNAWGRLLGIPVATAFNY